jgi:next-to-BRCA1 protein 1
MAHVRENLQKAASEAPVSPVIARSPPVEVQAEKKFDAIDPATLPKPPQMEEEAPLPRSFTARQSESHHACFKHTTN